MCLSRPCSARAHPKPAPAPSDRTWVRPSTSCPQKVSHQILVKGAAREHMMFVEGGDPLDVPVESLTVISPFDPEHREEAEELKPVLVTLNYVQFDTDMPVSPATRELQVGCIRTTQPSPRKVTTHLAPSAHLLGSLLRTTRPFPALPLAGQWSALVRAGGSGWHGHPTVPKLDAPN